MPGSSHRNRVPCEHCGAPTYAIAGMDKGVCKFCRARAKRDWQRQNNG